MFIVGSRSKDLGLRKRSIDRRLVLGPNAVKIFAIVILAVFSLFYLSQSSQSAAKNYIVSGLEEENNKVTAEKERLEVEANRLKALSIIQDKAQEKGMESSAQ
jgi:cell division protein FtsL